MSPLNILLVEDDNIDVIEFKRAISRSYVEIQELRICRYAEDALLVLESWLPHCIFIDYQLPKTNGLALLRRIKEIAPHIPVIVLTSQGDERIAVEMMKAGAMDYFPKLEVTPEKITRVFHAMSQMFETEQKRVQTQLELSEKEKLIDKIAKLSPNIIYVIDIEDKHAIFHNDQIWAILGYNSGSLPKTLNSFIFQVIHEEDLPVIEEHYRHLRSHAKDGEETEMEVRLKHRNGSDIWIISREVPFKRDDNGDVQQVLGIAIDITRRKSMETELIKAKGDAEAASKIKSDFLSTMSHEIRTPMNAIIGFTDVLLDSEITGESRDHLNTIKYSADNLMVILNDILDFSKIEAGKFDLDNFEFDLREKLGYLIKTFEVKAWEKEVELHVEIDEKVPHLLIGDAYRLNQILVNLLSNAIKFTHQGFVKLSVKVEHDSVEDIELRFEVLDSGIGISEDKLSSIFDSFSQVHHNNANKFFGGTGLGLTITRKLSEMMNGSIYAESQLEKGSKFSVLLKFKKIKITQPKLQAISTSDFSLKGYKILAAEDVLANQILLKHLFKKWEAEFVICDNGEELIKTIANTNFDLILMDIQMPVMDGLTTMKLLRKSYRNYDHIPVIAFTADTFAENTPEIQACNFSDFVTKPFKADELIKKISTHLLMS